MYLPSGGTGLVSMWGEIIDAFLGRVEAEAQRWMADRIKFAKEQFDRAEKDAKDNNKDTM